MRALLSRHGFAIDYATVRHPRTLAPLDVIDPGQTGGVVALAAGSLGGVRLIDNMAISPR